MTYQYDLFVIGAGSGGVRASRMAASKGWKVAVAESSALGGTCVNIGCVPKKLFVYAAEYGHVVQQAKGFGWDFPEPSFTWQRLRDNKTQEIQRLNGIYEKLLVTPGVDIYQGKASLVDAHTVMVNGERITAERILIAVGARPFVPDIEGKEHIWVSDDIFYLDELPSSVLVIGGGYIAVEFAGIFNGLGVETTLVHRGDKLLRGFDEDIRDFAQQEYVKSGIQLRLNCEVKKIAQLEDGEKLVTLSDNSQIKVGGVLCAAGRVPNTTDLGLEAAGVALTESGAIAVDSNFTTNIASVFALGDVTGKVQLTPVAIKEAMHLLAYWFDSQPVTLSYDNIPSAVFSQPNIGTVGLSEQEAVTRGFAIDVYQTDFRPMKHTLSGADERSFMKLIVDQGTDRVLGVHMVGDHAGEIIQGMGIAVTAGAKKADFDTTIGVHPTAAEEFVTFSANALKKR